MSEWCEDCKIADDRLKMACNLIGQLWIAVDAMASIEDAARRKRFAAAVDAGMNKPFSDSESGGGDLDIGGEA